MGRLMVVAALVCALGACSTVGTSTARDPIAQSIATCAAIQRKHYPHATVRTIPMDTGACYIAVHPPIPCWDGSIDGHAVMSEDLDVYAIAPNGSYKLTHRYRDVHKCKRRTPTKPLPGCEKAYKDPVHYGCTRP